MLVDLSHVSKELMEDVLAIPNVAPVIYSHTSAFTLCNHYRNVQDDVLLKVVCGTADFTKLKALCLFSSSIIFGSLTLLIIHFCSEHHSSLPFPHLLFRAPLGIFVHHQKFLMEVFSFLCNYITERKQRSSYGKLLHPVRQLPTLEYHR